MGIICSIGKVTERYEQRTEKHNYQQRNSAVQRQRRQSCSGPAELAQHHIAKSDWGFKSNQQIEEVLGGIHEFPAYMNLEEQGMFMLGYYHQRKAFYKKKM